jgi:glycosyl-4,4'-diaponeurosporenoate acyltransferase
VTDVIAWVGINATVWLVVAFGAGWWYRRSPVERFDDQGPVLRLRGFEVAGKWYERRLRIKRWKSHLPETGGRHGGMSKRQLPGHRRADLERFAAECRRGEKTH